MRAFLHATFAIFIISVFFLPLTADASGIKKDAVDVQTEYGVIKLTNLELRPGFPDVELTADVSNATSHSWDVMAIGVQLLDSKGQVLEPKSPMFKQILPYQHLTIIRLAAGEHRRIDPGERARVPVGDVSSGKIKDFQLRYVKEHSVVKASYVITMLKPAPSESLDFADDAIACSFALSDDQLGFRIQNKSNGPARILWDETSTIDPSGTSHRIIHTGVKLVDRDKTQAPTVVPPSAKVNDSVIPVDRIRYSEQIHDWLQEPFLPKGDAAIALKGQTFSLFMPIEVSGVKRNYTFTFEIADVRY